MYPENRSDFSCKHTRMRNFRSQKSDTYFCPIDLKQNFSGAQYVKVKLSVVGLSNFYVVSTDETKMFQIE